MDGGLVGRMDGWIDGWVAGWPAGGLECLRVARMDGWVMSDRQCLPMVGIRWWMDDRFTAVGLSHWSYFRVIG